MLLLKNRVAKKILCSNNYIFKLVIFIKFSIIIGLLVSIFAPRQTFRAINIRRQRSVKCAMQVCNVAKLTKKSLTLATIFNYHYYTHLNYERESETNAHIIINHQV